MSRPEDIPAEVWEAATECADVVEHAYWPGIKVIARAIMAAKAEEREACAAHLESEAKASPLGHESVQRGRSTYNWLAYCADLIRKRGEG